MKKSAIALIVILSIATPSYAVNIVDTMLCKKVVLSTTQRVVLVNRVTGEVKYILKHNGQWVLLKGVLKTQCQAMYKAQVYNTQHAGK